MHQPEDQKLPCAHCGEDCPDGGIRSGDEVFCCSGCKMVYELLNHRGLCDYYALNPKPGINRSRTLRGDKFAFLEDEKIASTIIRFQDESQTHVTFYLPQIHCSSCLYLLENLHRLEESVVSAKVHFPRKEVQVVFNRQTLSLRGLAELLGSIGYEPYISFNDLKQTKPRVAKKLIFQLGVAGFCFGNIMLLSFPEYLGMGNSEITLRSFFRLLNFTLSIPVLLFSARPFFESAWKSLQHRFLNIDAPIALAILVTYGRSVYEILTGRGPGYFDSMSGIVFFMLAGRILQDKTYQQLSFERDYTSYFPIAVSRVREGKEIPVALPEIRTGDTLLIHKDELIPADSILSKGSGMIDYSFVTGESLPVLKEPGEIVYAGGRQTGPNIEILVLREVTQSYLTSLWNRDKKDDQARPSATSFVHLLSRYFSYIVLGISAITAAWWWAHDPSKIGSAVTAVLIIACPCALLLSSTFTNANILQILARNHFYLRNAQTIENLALVDHIVFDKTGTLTSVKDQDIVYDGTPLTIQQKQAVRTLASQSRHPLSVALSGWLEKGDDVGLGDFSEVTGMGMNAKVGDNRISIGSPRFIRGIVQPGEEQTRVLVSWNNRVMGSFAFSNHYRQDMARLISQLKNSYQLSVVSGDGEGEKSRLANMFGGDAILLFRQNPESKKEYVKKLQRAGDKVAMIGDGLNDGIALQQSNVGIALAEDSNNFTPASDAILEAGQLLKLPAFLTLCKANRKVIMASFMLSIVYNLAGLYFAVQGTLSPLLAAILMPLSSMTILIVTYGASSWTAKTLKL